MTSTNRSLLRSLDGETLTPPPIWMMRQAGRYLPEYRATRAEAGSFLDLCYTPKHAIEVTLQPIRRYGFDAAILFSDILVIPDALGQPVSFETGVGPTLTPLDFDQVGMLKPEKVQSHLQPVFETVTGLRTSLPDDVTLLGFCGAPWTVATYMVAGKGTPDQAPARLAIHRNTSEMEALFDILVEASAKYLIAQLDAGADAVQIFDTWAGSLDDEGFQKWAIEPVRRIVDAVREDHPGARIIGFPKGAGYRLIKYVEDTGVTAVGLDWSVPLEFAAREIQTRVPVQGNLDPARLIVGGDALSTGVARILDALGSGPLIFNLGHGVTPDTPPEHVAQMIDHVRSA